MASRFLHLLSEERLDPEAVTNRLSLSASDNDLVWRRPHASRARNHVAWLALRQSMSVRSLTLWERQAARSGRSAREPRLQSWQPLSCTQGLRQQSTSPSNHGFRIEIRLSRPNCHRDLVAVRLFLSGHSSLLTGYSPFSAWPPKSKRHPAIPRTRVARAINACRFAQRSKPARRDNRTTRQRPPPKAY